MAGTSAELIVAAPAGPTKEQLTKRIEELKAELAVQQGNNRLKVNKPTPFTGKRQKFKHFLTQMNFYFSANHQ
jgi:hypothetical protein